MLKRRSTEKGQTSWFQKAGRSIHDSGIFVGCPIDRFEETARDPLHLARQEGLTVDSNVLEVGCGCLRVGYWFIQYLQKSRYCGIEPNVKMLQAGRKHILGYLESEKAPQLETNDDFDFGVFGRKFDFVIAFSIWSHASKKQISRMLQQFAAGGNAHAKFIASFAPSDSGRPDYKGDSWVGRSHKSDKKGTVAHSREWITQCASQNGLTVRFIDGLKTINQSWLVVTRRMSTAVDKRGNPH